MKNKTYELILKYYDVSSNGTVRRISTGHILSLNLMRGYKGFNPCIKHKIYAVKVHRLVAYKYVSGYKPGLTVNHTDGNKLNNNANNLEWISLKENINKYYKSNPESAKGINNCNNSLTPENVILIFNAKGYQKDIAKAFKIKQSTVSKIKNGERWAYLTGKERIIK